MMDVALSIASGRGGGGGAANSWLADSMRVAPKSERHDKLADIAASKTLSFGEILTRPSMSAMRRKRSFLVLVRTNSCASNEEQAEQVESDCADDDCQPNEVPSRLGRASVEAIACLRSEQQESREEPD